MQLSLAAALPALLWPTVYPRIPGAAYPNVTTIMTAEQINFNLCRKLRSFVRK